MKLSHTLSEIETILANATGNIIPLSVVLPADVLTPVLCYLAITEGADLGIESFLLESVVRGETAGRYSYIGAHPQSIIRSGDEFDIKGDPLINLEKVLSDYDYITVDGCPAFTGGAIGFVSYDCVQFFEPKTKTELKDEIKVPDSVFLLSDTLIAFDHLFQTVHIISHIHIPSSTPATEKSDLIKKNYQIAVSKITDLAAKVQSNAPVKLPNQKPIGERKVGVSNVGEAGYKSFVKELKEHIIQGDIIQAVPSQRLKRETNLHPFNAFRQLRQLNPSPYMFYINCGEDLQLVGASPECLCKVEKSLVTNHAIAGTVKRGKNVAEDEILSATLLASTKDKAEHVMLVDLARNDVNRVCKPETVKVDSLMQVEKFSHVMHLTSQVSGMLRDGLTRFDAFRSIFPAGTVSGAPKIKAIQLVAGLEKEKRGAYAGAVGRFNFAKDCMDTCIAIRTMTFKSGFAYLQAGGGIVFDSEEQEEWVETLNKLGANVRCLDLAEDYHRELQQKENSN